MREHRQGTVLLTEDLMQMRSGQVYLLGVRVAGRVKWYAQPLLLYPAPPLLPGQTWHGAAGAVTLSGRILSSEPLKTPAGKFNTLLLQLDVTQGQQKSRQLQYFVPGIGVVRYQDVSGKVIDMVSYTLR